MAVNKIIFHPFYQTRLKTIFENNEKHQIQRGMPEHDHHWNTEKPCIWTKTKSIGWFKLYFILLPISLDISLSNALMVLIWRLQTLNIKIKDTLKMFNDTRHHIYIWSIETQKYQIIHQTETQEVQAFPAWSDRLYKSSWTVWSNFLSGFSDLSTC